MMGRRGAFAALLAQSGLTVWLGLSLWILPGAATLPDRPAVSLYGVALGLLTGTGVVLARRQRHRLVPVLIGTGTGGTAFFAVTAAVLQGQHRLPLVGPVLAWLPTWLWLTVPVGIVTLLLRFPTGAPLGRWWRLAEVVSAGLALCLALLAGFMPGGDGTATGDPNPVGIPALAALTPVLNVLFTALPAAFLLGAAALAVRYRRGGPVERQQIRWVVAAAGVLAPVSAGTALLGMAWVAEAVAVVLLPGAIAVAVLRHRLWDLGLVLRRTLLYALLTAVLLGAYVGGVLSLDAALPTVPELLPEVLVTGVVAIVALPLREILQAALERVLFGARRDPHQVVRTLGRLLESTREPLLARVVSELAAALRLPWVAVKLPDGSVAAMAGTGGPSTDGLRLPLQVGGETVGELVASRRHPAEPLSPADRRLLTDLAGHLGVVVQSASLDSALRRSHERLTHIRAEERARLQRDLHDGLGPLLSATNMRVAAARNLLAEPADVDRAATVLDTVTADLAGALEEVQRIIADLRPGQLAERGLVAALRDEVDRWAGRLAVTLEVPDRLPGIDPATETAAYRIVVEALRNAERHSGGRAARVRLALADGILTVDVRDDGAGLPAAPVRVGAVGLRSMAERAEALGGTVQVESPAEGGTVIRGVLPGVLA